MMEEADVLLGNDAQRFSSGGWLQGAANALATYPGIELSIACPSPRVSAVTKLCGKQITYYVFNGFDKHGGLLTGDVPALDPVMEEILAEARPDVIDIQGSEFAHSLSCARSAGAIPTALTIQGILIAYQFHFWDGLDKRDRHWLGRDEISHQVRDFGRRAQTEKVLMQRVHHFIGRTAWDRAHSLAINPRAQYHPCNRILRSVFYSGEWEYAHCRPHRIFVSQAMYPLKGFHQLLKALPAVIETFPDTVVAVGGGGFGQGDYGRILERMIKEKDLSRHIEVLDTLDAEQMKEQFLLSNVYVLASSIENESISLSEAQLLGVPIVAAFTGGVPDSIPDNRCGALYPYEDTTLLARLICDAFEASPSFDNSHQREVAAARLDIGVNTEQLVRIYQDIVSQER